MPESEPSDTLTASMPESEPSDTLTAVALDYLRSKYGMQPEEINNFSLTYHAGAMSTLTIGLNVPLELARGGVVPRTQPYLVGEQGPEGLFPSGGYSQ